MHRLYILLLFIWLPLCLIAREQQKVVLLTGGSKGIGFEIARLLSEEGHIVYASYCTSPRHKLSYNPNIVPVQLDVKDPISIKRAVDSILSAQGRIDVLINNAGKVVIGTCETLLLEEQQEMMDVNYFGVVRMLQAVLPYMRKQKCGHIMNISSVSGFEPFPLTEGYGATKFALEGLSESLAVYLDKWNIQVTLIEPAGVKTTLALDAPLGKRFIEETFCFTKFCTEGKKALETSMEYHQSPKEIALLVSRILKEKHPHLRYQTNGIASAMAKSRFIDPSGDSSLASKKRKQQALLKMFDES